MSFIHLFKKYSLCTSPQCQAQCGCWGTAVHRTKSLSHQACSLCEGGWAKVQAINKKAILKTNKKIKTSQKEQGRKRKQDKRLGVEAICMLRKSLLIKWLDLSVENQRQWESQPWRTLRKEHSRHREQHMKGTEQEMLWHVQGSRRRYGTGSEREWGE